MFRHLFIDLLIHGEGGDGGASAAPGGEAAPGQEATGVQTPDAGEIKANRRLNKAERRAALEAKLQAERAAAQPQQNQQAAQQKTPWEDIKKQYKDEYGRDVQTAIQGRFKNQADHEVELANTKKELDKQSRLLAQLAEAQYGIKPGENGTIDLAAIEKAARKARIEEYAIENGVSEEFAEKRMAMEDELAEKDRKLREFQMAEEARMKSEEAYQLVQKHRLQAEAFRKEVPNFDLDREVKENKLFAHLIINCGVNVENAYYAAHHKELMRAGQQAAAMQATRALSTSIQAGQSMPTEGGLGRSPAASPQRAIDFKHRTKAEREAMHKAVRRGEKIYF